MTNSEQMMYLLPAEAYTSQEWFEREKRYIFSRTWAYAGFHEDLKEPGEYMPVQAGLNNIFIIKGQDDQLRAFHNMCRHRGARLVPDMGKAEEYLSCSYSDWTYDLEGNLVSVPDEQKEYDKLDKSQYGLLPASVGVWRGMIFVHPDPQAGDIKDWFGDIEPYMGPHKIEELKEFPDAAKTYEVKANWKLVVENFIDVYQLSNLHEKSMDMYDHDKAKFGFVGPHYAFKEPLSEEYEGNIDKVAPAPLIVPKDQLNTWTPMLFPGIGLVESESAWVTYIITPVAPDRTRIECRMRMSSASSWEFAKQHMRSGWFWEQKRMAAKEHWSDGLKWNDPLISGDVIEEDIFACEQQQISMQSEYYASGPVAHGERPILEHQKVIIEWLEKEEKAS